MKLPTIEIAKNEYVPKLGLGTWGIGGYLSRFQQSDDRNEIEQIKYQLKMGLTVIDCWVLTGGGSSLDIIREAIAGFKREKLFLIAKIDPKFYKSRKDIPKVFDQYLKQLGVEYMDMIQIHSPNYPILTCQEVVEEMNDIVRKGLSRMVGISNASVEEMKDFMKYSEFPLTSNEIPYNLVDRSYEKNGVIDFCRKNDIKIISFQSVARGAIAHFSHGGNAQPHLRDICLKYDISPAQLGIAWLASKNDVLMLVKSSNRSHIVENIKALSVKLEKEDLKILDEFRVSI